MLQCQGAEQGRETPRVTDAGIQMVAATRQRNEAALSTHEAWVEARGAADAARWAAGVAPAEPVMREIKVRQADLLSDPRPWAKVQAHQALASQCWCGVVLGMGLRLRLVLAAKNKAPQTCGLTVADGYVPEVLCPAPQRPISQSFPPRWLWPRRYTTPGRGSSRKRLWGNCRKGTGLADELCLANGGTPAARMTRQRLLTSSPVFV